MHPFREVVESAAHERVAALLADDVTFVSPVAFAPYRGRGIVTAILRGAFSCLEDFRYVNEIGYPGGRDHALVFKARVGDREIHGCDFLHHNPEGLIDEFTVMVRPLSGAKALAEAMEAKFASIEREAAVLADPPVAGKRPRGGLGTGCARRGVRNQW
jgi:hypothetical protein